MIFEDYNSTGISRSYTTGVSARMANAGAGPVRSGSCVGHCVVALQLVIY